jgi:hypothetical protein
MSKLVDLLLKNKPKNSQANTKGVDKTPIGAEFPFPNSKDLVKTDLKKDRYGAIGSNQYAPASTVPGYNETKKYTDSVKGK